jgi:phage/conjugal plasmid C-4 type zinc finger TraR family protein
MLSPQLKTRLELGLAARRKQLEGEIRDKLAAAREVMGTGAIDQLIETGDAAVAEFLVGVDLAEIKRDLAELRELDRARERLAAGTYGVCSDCGADIPPSRLEAYPTALRCIDCQSRWEMKPGAQHPRRP